MRPGCWCADCAVIDGANLTHGSACGHSRDRRVSLRRPDRPRERRRRLRDRGTLMLVVMQNDATDEQIRRVVDVIKEMGYEGKPMPGAQRTTVGLVGNDGRVDGSRLESLEGVAEIIHA